MQVTFKVTRYDRATGEKPRVQSYALDLPEGATILDGMMRIREEQDPTLAFRAACLRGVCGECTMRVNKSGKLACVTRVASIAKNNEVTVEPIRYIPVIKDLVFDMEAFLWRKIKAVEPWLKPNGGASDREHVLREEELAEVRKAMSCYMCGLCDEGCTVIAVDGGFLGPAALTKAYRFVFDPRDHARVERLRHLSEPKGMWDCTHCFEANGHCPRGINPTDRIFDLRDESIRRGVKSGAANQQVARHYDSFVASVKKSGWLDEGRLAIESEGWTNVAGLLELLPTAVKALQRGKLPMPYLHRSRPGAEQIRRIIERAEGKPS
ncbi:MAG: succinate dehydrogenase/fumarate reductase iron-sulfur subunit [Deltaproteobacteria bacterium]|nr:succinate dehydrogenase/fumarate reductase iron-sulfur subunit [Deltaproteobacteria bacterium]